MDFVKWEIWRSPGDEESSREGWEFTISADSKKKFETSQKRK